MDRFETTELRLRRAARRAYERGRLKGAAVRGAGALVLGLPGFLACGRTLLAAGSLAGFALVVAAARHRGRGFEQGARAGFVAGLLPCLAPAALRILSPDLCDLLFARGPWICALGGVAAGLVLGLRSRGAGGAPFWSGAAVTFALAAVLGCLPAGAMGFAGLLAGLVAGGLPGLAARRASV